MTTSAAAPIGPDPTTDPDNLRLDLDLAHVTAWLHARYPELETRIAVQLSLRGWSNEIAGFFFVPPHEDMSMSLGADLYRAMGALGYRIGGTRDDLREIWGPLPREMSSHLRLQGYGRIRDLLETTMSPASAPAEGQTKA